MSWPGTIYLVRHAESDGNIRSVDERAKYEVASPDYDLTPRGRAQAEVTGAWLRKLVPKPTALYTSYYKRAVQTAAFLYPGYKVYVDPRLAEAQRGVYHTMTASEIDTAYPYERLRKEREGLYHYRPLGGENWPDVELRIHSFLGTLYRDYEKQDEVVIVCHGHWLILFEKLIQRFSLEEAVRRYQAGIVTNASVTTYRHDGREWNWSKTPMVPATDPPAVE